MNTWARSNTIEQSKDYRFRVVAAERLLDIIRLVDDERDRWAGKSIREYIQKEILVKHPKADHIQIVSRPVHDWTYHSEYAIAYRDPVINRI